MTSAGSILYVTGGTTARPRFVRYNSARWTKSVSAKLCLFKLYEIGGSSRVAVCHPFAPWAIGQVFADAAFRAGATVLPLGLPPLGSALFELLREFQATHMCASAANLIRWGAEVVTDKHNPKLVLVAGERLTPERRRDVERIWRTNVVNIYGMAEFDMVAAELPETGALCLVPHLNYRLSPDTDAPPRSDRPLMPGDQGELLISEEAAGPWHRTGDRVEVLDTGDFWGMGATTHAIRFMDRTDGAVTFADGSMLAPAHLSRLQETEPDIDTLQAVLRRDSERERLELLFTTRSMGPKHGMAERLRRRLLETVIDLADAFAHGCIDEITCREVDAALLHRTCRGKVPAIWLDGAHDDA